MIKWWRAEAFILSGWRRTYIEAALQRIELRELQERCEHVWQSDGAPMLCERVYCVHCDFQCYPKL